MHITAIDGRGEGLDRCPYSENDLLFESELWMVPMNVDTSRVLFGSS